MTEAEARTKAREIVNSVSVSKGMETGNFVHPDTASALCVAVAQAVLAASQSARDAAIEDAAKECDKIASNTEDFTAFHRRAAGQCAFVVRALRSKV